MYTLFVSISTRNIISPFFVFTSIAPVLIQSALIPIVFNIFVIIAPSTRAPMFHVFPPSVDMPHPEAFNFTTTFDFSIVG